MKSIKKLLIVVFVALVSLTLYIGTTGGVKEGAPFQSHYVKMVGIETLLDSYKLIGGTYPSESQGLDALVNKPTTNPLPRNWKQQATKIPLDPWQNEFVYKFPGTIEPKRPEIIFVGPDGLLGTKDDISSQDR